jgi:hypothetical protein
LIFKWQGPESEERDKYNLEKFNLRLQDSVLKLQIDQHRKPITKKITKALNEELQALGPKLKQEILHWTGSPNYAELAMIEASGNPPMIEGAIADLDARMYSHLKKTKLLREIKVDDLTHGPNEGSESKRERQKLKEKQEYDSPISFRESKRITDILF